MDRTLDDSLKMLLKEKEFLFRGTNTYSFDRTKTKSGMYFGRHNGETDVTSTTLSLYNAMVNAHTRADSSHSRGGAPMLIAINAVPYLNRITKGLEWATYRKKEDGIVEPDEYEIHGQIDLRDIQILDNLDVVKKFAAPLTTDGEETMKRLFDTFILRKYLTRSS
ncbi:MAG TPA: hypothetical protein VKE88_01695 [Candidatus Nanoarchaeia archaeon]|nr:hypothetical protein [Candidatus Nanoarchaeia archaeon]